MYDGLAILGVGMGASQREISADCKGKCSGSQAGFPATVPGADHDSDGEDNESALDDVRKQERGNQRENRAEEGNSVSEYGGPSRRNETCAEKGELHSHTTPL